MREPAWMTPIGLPCAAFGIGAQRIVRVRNPLCLSTSARVPAQGNHSGYRLTYTRQGKYCTVHKLSNNVRMSNCGMLKKLIMESWYGYNLTYRRIHVNYFQRAPTAVNSWHHCSRSAKWKDCKMESSVLPQQLTCGCTAL